MTASRVELRYDTVIFDVGGTLIGFFDREPFRQFLSAAGLPATAVDTAAFHRRFVSAMVAQRDTAQGLGAREEQLFAWWHAIFERTWPERPDLAEEMDRWLAAGRFDRVFPDVCSALEVLKTLGLKLGVLSNFVGYLEDLLRRLGLRGYFDFVVVSALVGLAKPDPRIFDLATARAMSSRSRLLYVGDHFGDDIGGARASGLDAVLIDRANRHDGADCARIQSLTELARYVRRPVRPATGILLDLDGVVLDSMPAHLLSWQRALAPLGIELTAEDLYPLEGVPTEATARLLTERLLGQACSDLGAQHLAETKRSIFRQVFSPRFIPGIVPLLHDLQGRGYRLGLVTGSHCRLVDHYLGPNGLLRLFAAVVTGDQVSRGKPDPEPYRTAADRLGLAPAACLAVENSPLGLQSARAAGMCCVALETTLPAQRLGAADYLFADVGALRAWLLREWSDQGG